MEQNAKIEQHANIEQASSRPPCTSLVSRSSCSACSRSAMVACSACSALRAPLAVTFTAAAAPAPACGRIGASCWSTGRTVSCNSAPKPSCSSSSSPDPRHQQLQQMPCSTRPTVPSARRSAASSSPRAPCHRQPPPPASSQPWGLPTTPHRWRRQAPGPACDGEEELKMQRRACHLEA